MGNTRDFKFFLKDVIMLLRANILDLKKKRLIADEKEKDYINARLFSYQEIIASIKNQLQTYNITPDEIGLDELNDIL